MKSKLLVTALSLLFTGNIYAENNRSDYDLDNDGLIEINDLDDLNEIRNNLDGSSLYGSSDGCPNLGCTGFELTTDLDFDLNGDGQIDANDPYWNNGSGWSPMGVFTATLDGNNHEIKNLFINLSFLSRVALITEASDAATIRNLSLTGEAGQVIGSTEVGTIVGECAGCTIENVSSTLNVTGSLDRVGGLVGLTGFDATISRSHATGNVSTPSGPVGGLIGEARSTRVEESYATGDISGRTSVGGLIGVSSNTITIATFATGDVTTGDFAAGGLIGRTTGFTEGLTIASFATGNVSGNGTSTFDRNRFIGGLIGLVSNHTVVNSYATGLVSGDSLIGGLFGGGASGEANYWATDATGQNFVSGTSPQSNAGDGVLLSELQCPTAINDASCSSVLLYENWDIPTNTQGDRYWHFGSSSELPGLLINGMIFRDGNGVPVPGTSFNVVNNGVASPMSTIMYEGNKGGHTLSFNQPDNSTKINIFDWTAAGHYASMVILATGENRDSQGLDLSDYNELKFEYRCNNNVSIEAFFGSDKDNAQNYLGDVNCNDEWNTEVVNISGMTKTDIATALWLYAPAYKNTFIPGNAFDVEIRDVILSE